MFRRTALQSATLLFAAVASAQGVVDRAIFQSYGDNPCAPTLSGFDAIQNGQHSLRYDLSNAPANAPTALVLGLAKADVALPGGCDLLVSPPFLSIPGMTDGSGVEVTYLSAPGTVVGTLFAQSVVLGQSGIPTSNGLETLFPGRSPTVDPTTERRFPCYYISNYGWNYGGDGVGVVTGKIRWPSQTCNPADGPPSGRPVVVFMHGNGMTHTDHDYLMAHLARNGFVTCSIQNGSHMGGTNEGRAREAISYLNAVNAFWQFRNRLSGDVIFMGHSRGGEAAITASRLLYQDPGMAHRAYDVDAVVSIAPTDGGGNNGSPKETISGHWTDAFLGIYGSRDPDVRGIRLEDPLNGPENTVFAIYDRAGSEGSSEGFLIPGAQVKKSLVYVHGGTHRGFLDTCNGGGFGSQLSCENHRNLAMGYINAFLHWHVDGETDYRAYFDNRSTPTRLRITDTEIFTQLSDHPRRVVDNFEQGGAGQSTIQGSVYMSPGIAAFAEGDLWQLDPSAPHDTRGMRIKWRPNSPVPYTRWSIPDATVPFVGPTRDVSRYDHLSFRVAQDYLDAWNVAGEDQDFYVRLRDSNGLGSFVRVSEWGRIPYPDPFITHPYPYPAGDYTKTAMSTIRIPTSAFGVDLTDVRSVYFYFTVPGHTRGSVIVDSLEFVD